MSDQPFNPSDHITIVNGGAYLPVKDICRAPASYVKYTMYDVSMTRGVLPDEDA